MKQNPHLTEKAKLGFKKDSLLFYEKDNKTILDQLKFTFQQVTILPQLEEMEDDLSPPPFPSDSDAFEKRM